MRLNKGFTLIEVLVTAIIASFVLLGVGMAINQTVRIERDIMVKSQIQNALSGYVQQLNNRLKASTAVEKNGDNLVLYGAAGTATDYYRINQTDSVFEHSTDGKVFRNALAFAPNVKFVRTGDFSAADTRVEQPVRLITYYKSGTITLDDALIFIACQGKKYE